MNGKLYEESERILKYRVLMKLPDISDVEFTPMAWKEWLLYGPKSDFKSQIDIFKYIEKENDEGKFRDFSVIANYVRNERIRRLLNGYALLDVLDCSQSVQYLRIKMWRLFEDLVGEILRAALRNKNICAVANVDRWPGFQGLDFIITNSESRLGWKVGVQCKRYVGTHIAYNQVSEYSSFSRGTSAASLYHKGEELKRRFPHRKRVLIAFNAYTQTKNQRKRLRNLSESWNLVMILDENKSDEHYYKYKLRCNGLDKILRWC